MIDITGTDLRKFVAKAYELSSPQGMGFLHHVSGPLDDETIDYIVAQGNDLRPVSMDYVRGRSIKMTVHSRDGKLLINDKWYDHGEKQLAELLESEGVVNNGHVE